MELNTNLPKTNLLTNRELEGYKLSFYSVEPNNVIEGNKILALTDNKEINIFIDAKAPLKGVLNPFNQLSSLILNKLKKGEFRSVKEELNSPEASLFYIGVYTLESEALNND